MWHDNLETWLEENANVDVIDIKFGKNPNGRGVVVIIYKEANQNENT